MSNIVAIRKATTDDVEAIYKLNCDEMGYYYNLANTLERLRFTLSKQDHCVMVATLDSLVVGYIHANNYDLLYSDPLKNILGIAVSKTYKRMGIGRKLIAAIEDWAKADGAVGVRLASGATRAEAHLFYISCGYTKNKEQLNFTKIFLPNIY